MTAVHVFMGQGYYPEQGLGDYKKSFYSNESEFDSSTPQAVLDGWAYVEKEFKDSGEDWWSLIEDSGEGLVEIGSGYKR
jgi:hypothetical protein